MEHIGEVLGNLSRGIPTQSQKIYEMEMEPTLEERKEQLRESLCVASLENTFENFKPMSGTEKALAVFKALGRALRQAVQLDPRQTGLPSTKGVL